MKTKQNIVYGLLAVLITLIFTVCNEPENPSDPILTGITEPDCECEGENDCICGDECGCGTCEPAVIPDPECECDGGNDCICEDDCGCETCEPAVIPDPERECEGKNDCICEDDCGCEACEPVVIPDPECECEGGNDCTCEDDCGCEAFEPVVIPDPECECDGGNDCICEDDCGCEACEPVVIDPQQILIDFEDSAWSGSGYTMRTVASGGYQWTVSGVGNMTAADRRIETRSLRLRGNNSDNCRLELMDYLSTGITSVSFDYASYSTHKGGIIVLYYQINGSDDWEKAGEVTAPSWVDGGSAMLNVQFDLNITDSVRIKIVREGSPGDKSTVNIDNIVVNF